MKTWSTIPVGIVAILLLVAVLAYAIGARLPVRHTVSVTGIVSGPPEKVFNLITDVSAQPRWRRGLQSVDMLRSGTGQVHWIEHTGHGKTMTLLVAQSQPPTLREVIVQVPGNSYGGSWTYALHPESASQTRVTITEEGFVNPQVYRFMMRYILGQTSNLESYLTDLKHEADKP